jgi:5-methylcytosine-specific restriction endonuclease McrA
MHYQRLRHHGTTDVTVSRLCQHCNREFIPVAHAKFCGAPCRYENYASTRKDLPSTYGRRCAVAYQQCQYCAATFTSNRQMPYPTCRRVECKRARQAERMRSAGYMAKYYEKHGRDRSDDQFRRALRRGAPEGERFRDSDVFERDGWMCGICLDPIDPSLVWPDRMSKTVDHILPVSLGGKHSLDNVRAAHARCNFSRGAARGEDVSALVA